MTETSLAPTPVPPTVDAARRVLLAITDKDAAPGVRLRCAAALAQLEDVFPPYPPARLLPLGRARWLGPDLIAEATTALLAAVEEAGTPAERARALMALEEVSIPLTPPWADA